MRKVNDALGGKNNFDALRLLAAIGVIFSHAYPATEGSNKAEPLYILSGGQETIGGVCVAIFFIISGFLITQSWHRSSSLLGYFVNRVLRIVPALAVITLLTCLVLGPIITSATANEYWTSYLTFRYIGNVLIYPSAQKLPGVFETSTYQFVTNASTWTLSYEFTCYILVAGLGLIYRRVWAIALIICIIGIATIYWTYISPSIFLKFAGCFFAGGVVFLARNHILLDARLFALSLMILGLTIIFHSGISTALCVFGTYSTIYVAYALRLPIHGLTSHGDFSYGVYLYAWPVQQIVAPHSTTPFGNFAMSLPIVLVCGALSWKLVESPSMSKRKSVATFLNERLGKTGKIAVD
jgi:peptidoglycan/LPS O-acetylase OafA/YrhL